MSCSPVNCMISELPLPPDPGETPSLPEQSEVEEVVPVDLPMDENPEQMSVDRVVFQIFADPVDVVPLTELDFVGPPRKRLPSIVVEPTDLSDVESGELRWPPQDQDSEDLCLDQSPPEEDALPSGENHEEEGAEDEGDEDEVDEDGSVPLPAFLFDP